MANFSKPGTVYLWMPKRLERLHLPCQSRLQETLPDSKVTATPCLPPYLL